MPLEPPYGVDLAVESSELALMPDLPVQMSMEPLRGEDATFATIAPSALHAGSG